MPEIKINHLNYYTGPDALIYCEKQKACVNATQKFVDQNCSFCPMFNGHLQGEGIECLYEDNVFKGDNKPSFVGIDDPYGFMHSRRKVLDKKGKYPKLIVKRK